MKLNNYQKFLTVSIISSYLAGILPTQAQIASDRSMSKPTVVQQVDNIFEITRGTTAGSNLFHSFEKFSVPSGNTASFINNNSAISNVIGRVTGILPSEILGRIEAAGTAPNFNLFLINPNGIIFGPNASLALNGSFIATTANAIQFGNQGYFSASSPNDPYLLNVQPSAFFFNQVRAKPISYQSSNQKDHLEVPNGKSLLLLGGDVTLDGKFSYDPDNKDESKANKGTLQAPNGRVELGGLAGKGTVRLKIDGDILSLAFPDNVERANVLLKNGATIDVSDRGRGSIAINAKNIDIISTELDDPSQSKLLSGISIGLQSDGAEAGKIELKATEAITITNSYIANYINKEATGNTGDISIQASSLSLIDSGQIITSSIGPGNPGNIIIDVQGPVTLRGQIITDSNSIVSQINSSSFGADGRSGNIIIQAKSLSLADGAAIQTSIEKGIGGGGNINVRVDDFISLENTTNSTYDTGIFSGVGRRAVGNGGNIDIQARSLSLTGGSLLGSSLNGGNPGAKGKGGNITVNVSDSVNISGVGPTGSSSGILSFTEKGAEGQAGDITINTHSFHLSDGAVIDVSNLEGQAGNLKISADTLTLNKASITAETGKSGGQSGANISLQLSNLLSLENESLISATANGDANGGNIAINSLFLLAFPPTGPNGSNIIAKAERGKGGKINIQSQGIFGIAEGIAITGDMSNKIDASSEFGASGQVQINSTLDPNRGVIRLPETVVDPNALIAQNPCLRGTQSQFVRTGRGGLPPSPREDLSSQATQARLVEPIKHSIETAVEESDSILIAQPIIPAQGWVFNEQGEVVLVAYDPTVTGSLGRLPSSPPSCSVP